MEGSLRGGWAEYPSGRRQSARGTGRGRQKHSAWFLTISSNKFEADNPGLKETFHAAMLGMVGEGYERGISSILDFSRGAPGDNFDNNVQFVESRVVTEIGGDPRGGRVHGHILINIRHTSKIWLSRAGITNWILPRINPVLAEPLTKLYIHWQNVGYSINIEEYMEKHEANHPPDQVTAATYAWYGDYTPPEASS
jgi:hypothetical protein